jgi:hypothetical protein
LLAIHDDHYILNEYGTTDFYMTCSDSWRLTMLDDIVTWLDAPTSRLFVWGVLARGLAFTYFVAQTSLALQIIPLGAWMSSSLPFPRLQPSQRW